MTRFQARPLQVTAAQNLQLQSRNHRVRTTFEVLIEAFEKSNSHETQHRVVFELEYGDATNQDLAVVGRRQNGLYTVHGGQETSRRPGVG